MAAGPPSTSVLRAAASPSAVPPTARAAAAAGDAPPRAALTKGSSAPSAFRASSSQAASCASSMSAYTGAVENSENLSPSRRASANSGYRWAPGFAISSPYRTMVEAMPARRDGASVE